MGGKGLSVGCGALKTRFGPRAAGAMKPWGQRGSRACTGALKTQLRVIPWTALEPLKLSLGRRAAGAMKPWGQRTVAEWAERAGGVGVAGMHWSPYNSRRLRP